MPRFHIPFARTGRFSSLLADYLEGERLAGFRVHAPTMEGLEAAAAQRDFGAGERSVLIQALQAQYAGTDIHPEVQASLRRLAEPDALTITTGHQLCLFGGPLYVPFKVLNVVRLARETSQRLGRSVVPVFWMASEDHDREEIDHAWLGPHRVHWPGNTGGAVGRMPLDGFDAVLKQVADLLGPLPHADQMRDMLFAAYRPDRTLAQATRHLFNALFGRFGVVVVDGDDPLLKARFAPLMREEVINQVGQRSVTYANERLAPLHAPQAHVRDINLFHLRPGHRSRILLEDGHYRVDHGGPVFGPEAIEEAILQRPQDFSPNVLMRPVYQELVLPNIAYVGGAGELAYWLQLRWLFQALQVPMPVVLPRSSAGSLGAKAFRQWSDAGLSPEELFDPLSQVLSKAAMAAAGADAGVERERNALEAIYSGLATRATAVDPSLEGAVQAARTRAIKGLDRVSKAMVRAVKRRETVLLERLGNVHAGLFPGGGLQERRHSFMPLLATHGDGLFDHWLEMLDALKPGFTLEVED